MQAEAGKFNKHNIIDEKKTASMTKSNVVSVKLDAQILVHAYKFLISRSQKSEWTNEQKKRITRNLES